MVNGMQPESGAEDSNSVPAAPYQVRQMREDYANRFGQIYEEVAINRRLYLISAVIRRREEHPDTWLCYLQSLSRGWNTRHGWHPCILVADVHDCQIIRIQRGKERKWK